MNELEFNGVIGWDIEASTFNKQLKAFNGEDVILNIGSGGGYITEGLSIMASITNYPGKVTARISVAASMATQVALACDNLEVHENAVFMIHEASGGVYGRAKDMIAKGNLLNSYNKMLSRNYITKTGKSEKEIATLMDAETYMFGQEIVDEGFADVVIGAKVDGEKDENILKDLAKNMFNDCNAKLNEKPEDHTKLVACMDNLKQKDKDFNVNIDGNNEIKVKDDTIVAYTTKNQGDSVEKEFTQEDVDNSVASDRIRISAIMGIDCSEEMKTDAINNGTNAGDLALSVLAKQKEEKVSARADFVTSAVSADVVVSDPEDEMSEEDAKTKEALKALEGDK